MPTIELSETHLAAVNRPRRIVVNCDTACAQTPDPWLTLKPERLLEIYFQYIDDPETQIDSVWWNWGEGNEPYWPSQVLADVGVPDGYEAIFAKGVDFVRLVQQETTQRGREAFFSLRANGTDMRPYKGGRQVPMKEAHPDWLMDWSVISPDDKLPTWELPETSDNRPNYMSPWNPRCSYWNFAAKGVREYKVSILREIAENYDFDGIDVDFARVCPVLPIGHQWEYRDCLTDFMRSVRSMLQEVARKRGRPFLLAARVPETIEGCHFDGIDVETWVREQLVDILGLGVRSFDVDVEDFRRITSGTHVKLYPSHDNCHYSDAYDMAHYDDPVQVVRGVCSNFLAQGADGILAFNFAMMSADKVAEMGYKPAPDRVYEANLQALREIGSKETLRGRDKIFPVQRRGGGHRLFARTENWYTPRIACMNSNMFGQLPARLSNTGKGDTMLHMMIGDDVNAEADRISTLELRLLLSDGAAANVPADRRIEPAVIRPLDWIAKGVYNKAKAYCTCPPEKTIVDQIEVRINNVLLPRPAVDNGWLAFPASPRVVALGRNLVGVRVTGRPNDVQQEISIEKLELHVRYRRA